MNIQQPKLLKLFIKGLSKEIKKNINKIEEDEMRKINMKKGKILFFFIRIYRYLCSKIEPFISSVYFVSFILVVATISLLNGDLKVAGFGHSADEFFNHLNEAIFFIFLIEFSLSFFFEHNFIGSFFFWVDFFSLISFIPEVELIWHPFSVMISGDRESVVEEFENLYLKTTSIASGASSTASKYIKIIKLLNFVKIIRLAKIIEETKKIKNINLNNNNMNALKYKLNLNFEMKKRKTSVRVRINSIQRKSTTLLTLNKWKKAKMSQFDSQIKSTLNKIKKTNPQPHINSTYWKVKIEGIDIFDHDDNNDINNKSFDYENNWVNPIESDLFEYLEKNNLYLEDIMKENKLAFEAEALNQSKDEFVRNPVTKKSFFGTVNMRSKLSHKMTNKENVIKNLSKNELLNSECILKKFVLNKNIIKDMETHFSNSSKDSANSSSDDKMKIFTNKISNYEKNDILEKNDSVNSSKYSVNSNFGLTTKRDNQDFLILNENKYDSLKISNEIIEEPTNTKENKIDTYLELHTENNLVTHNDLQDNKKTLKEHLSKLIANLILKNSKNIEKNIENNQNIGTRLIESINRRVILIITLLLIMLPVMDPDYIYSIVYPSESSVHLLCISAIHNLMTSSLENPYNLAITNKIIHKCVNETLENEDYPLVLAIDFSHYEVYKNLTKKYNQTKYKDDLPNTSYHCLDFDDLMHSWREESEYIHRQHIFDETDEISEIEYVANEYKYCKLVAFLGLMKTLFVGILLSISTKFFNDDVNIYAIKPLEIITAKLDTYIYNSEFEYHHKNYENVIDKIIKNKPTDIKNMETYYIDNLLKKLINLTSQSLNKSIISVVKNHDKNLDLNLKFEGIKYNAAILMMKINNIEKLMVKYQKNGLKYINKIYSLLHINGLKCFGDIHQNLLIWKLNSNETYYMYKKYILRIGNLFKFDSEENKEIIDTNKSENITGLALLCANMFINSLKEEKDLIDIFNENNLSISILLDYGIVYKGFIGSDERLQELVMFNNNKLNEKILKLINYTITSILLTSDFYEYLSEKLKRFTYPCHIIKIKKNNNMLYRQYIDYKKFNKIKITPKHNFIINEEIINDRIILEENYKRNIGDLSEMIIENKIFKSNVGIKVPHFILDNILSIYRLFRKSNFKDCETLLSQLDHFHLNKIYDLMLINQVISFEKILSNAKKQSNINYTIELV